MALTLTEDIVRSRVNLTHDNLEDVKSLALPGTYHEKIISLGDALRKFSRLKALDLSRNALETVEGIENLDLLEKLNLYYNNISDLGELKRLKHTPNLRELDLRLNPVTRSEPDYRLYLIHMLPHLQKLDDRGVRDRERQAALTHFSSSQATEMTYHPPRKEPPQKPIHPRAELTAKLGKPSVLDDDDVAVMDLVAMKEGDLSRPRPLTGSAAKEPAMEEYSLEMLKSLSSQDATFNGVSALPPPGKTQKRSSSLPPPKNEDDLMAAYKDKYPNIASLARDDMHRKKRTDPNLQYQDELDAYSKYKSHGFFTPHPGRDDEEGSEEVSQFQAERTSHSPGGDDAHRNRELEQPPLRDYERKKPGSDGDATSRGQHRRTHSVPNSEPFPTERDVPEPTRTFHQSLRPSSHRYDAGLIQQRLDDNPSAKELLFRILDLADRYWNGSKSLHQHAKFLGLALDVIEKHSQEGPLAGMQQDVQSLKQRVERLQDENSTLRERQSRRSDADTTTASEAQLKSTLKQARSDVGHLREELQHYVKKNASLQRKLEQQQESGASFTVSGAASSTNPMHLDDIQRQNDALSSEIEGLRGRLKQYAQMQELASMLQDSHKSLVQTNDHLLKEMDGERKRHRHEVEQMHWSYDQLKKTISYLPSSIKGDSTLNINTNASMSGPHHRDTDR
ncbi:centrosomal protein of 72 kDa-like isoform X2 [Littorina saxatilis]|uniref:Centrosomal protein of 72 kDa n=1 Tax=Littorina saxatilis TaxID=31220 RepID=A0AAN9BZM5_9CAEN